MSVRLRPTSAPKMSSHTQTQSVLVAEVTTTDSPVAVVETEVTPMKSSRNFMSRNHLWVYILIAIIVLVIIFWYACSGCRADEFDKLHCKGIEWMKGSCGRAVMALFLIIALLLLAWSASTVSGCYRMMGDMGRANMVMGLFIVIIILVLIAFIFFYQRDFNTAYWFMLFVLLLGILATIMFAYFKFTGPALAMALFSLWALFIVWCFYKVGCCNPCHKGGNSSGSSGSNGGSSGSSGSGASSGSGESPKRTPHHHHSPH